MQNFDNVPANPPFYELKKAFYNLLSRISPSAATGIFNDYRGGRWKSKDKVRVETGVKPEIEATADLAAMVEKAQPRPVTASVIPVQASTTNKVNSSHKKNLQLLMQEKSYEAVCHYIEENFGSEVPQVDFYGRIYLEAIKQLAKTNPDYYDRGAEFLAAQKPGANAEDTKHNTLYAGYLYMQGKDFIKARVQYDAALKTLNGDPEGLVYLQNQIQLCDWVNTAEEQFENGNLEQAIVGLEEASAKVMANPNAYGGNNDVSQLMRELIKRRPPCVAVIKQQTFNNERNAGPSSASAPVFDYMGFEAFKSLTPLPKVSGAEFYAGGQPSGDLSSQYVVNVPHEPAVSKMGAVSGSSLKKLSHVEGCLVTNGIGIKIESDSFSEATEKKSLFQGQEPDFVKNLRRIKSVEKMPVITNRKDICNDFTNSTHATDVIVDVSMAASDDDDDYDHDRDFTFA